MKRLLPAVTSEGTAFWTSEALASTMARFVGCCLELIKLPPLKALNLGLGGRG